MDGPELNQRTEGTTLGQHIDIDYTYFLGKHIGISAKLSLMSGVLRKIRLQNGNRAPFQHITLDKEKRENLSRVDISIGIVMVF